MATVVWTNKQGETVRSHTLNPGETAQEIANMGGTVQNVERPRETKVYLRKKDDGSGKYERVHSPYTGEEKKPIVGPPEPTPYQKMIMAKQKEYERRISLYKRYQQEKDWEKYKKTSRGKREIEAVAKSEHEKLLEAKYGKYAISTISVYDYPKAESIVKEKRYSGESVYDSLASRTRYSYSFSEAGLSALASPITFPQMIIKRTTGIQAGPDVSASIQESRITPTEGVISGTMGDLFNRKMDYKSQFEKYPVETIFSSAGEVFGLLTAGKTVQVGKTFLGKGWGKIGLPELSQYSPGALLRKWYWKAKTKLGLADYKFEPAVWENKALFKKIKPSTGKPYKYAELPGASKQLSAFKSTVSNVGDDILTIHASPSRFKWLSRVKVGTSETPGLSVSAFGKGSPHFLKIGRQYLSYKTQGISLFPKFKMPTAPVIKLKDVFRLPKNLRKQLIGETTEQYYKRVGSWLSKQPKGKWGTIAAKSEIGGAEIEAIIRHGTFLKRVSSRSWTTFKGHAVPLPEYVPIGKGMPSLAVKSNIGETVIGSSAKLKEFLSPYSYGKSTIPILSPSYLGYSILSKPKSNIKSYKSKEYFYSKPSKPSIISKPSIPSVPSVPSVGSPPSIPSVPSVPSVGSPPSIPSVPSVPSVKVPSIPPSPPKVLSVGILKKGKRQKFDEGLWRKKYRFRKFVIKDLFSGVKL